MGLALLLASSLTFAATPPMPADPAAHTVMVPFDETKPLAGQKPQRYYLDREDFERLWAAAKENRKPAVIEDKDDAQPEAVVQTALYRGTLEDERVVIEVQFTLQTRGRWAKTSLALRQTRDKAEAALREITLDGKPAALSAGELAIESAGTHSVIATYEIPRPKRWTSVGYSLPQARASTLMLMLGSSDGMPFINDAKLVAMLDDSGPQRVVTCVLGSSSELKIERTPRRPLVAAPPPTASAKTVLAVAADLRSRAESTLRYSFPGASRKEVAFSVEPGWDVVGVNANLNRDAAKTSDDSTANTEANDKAKSVAAAVTRISLAKQGERSVFTVGFAHEIIDEASLVIGLSPVAAAVPKSVPLVLPIAAKLDLIAGLAVADGVTANAQPLPGQTRLSDVGVDWKSLGFQQPGSALHYHLPSRMGVPPVPGASGVSPDLSSLAITAVQASSGTAARADYVFQLSPQKAEVSAAIVLTRERGEWTQARVGVPAGMEIQSVVGPQVTAWQQVGDEVFLHFMAAANGQGKEVRFVIYLASGSFSAGTTGNGQTKTTNGPWLLKPFTLPDVEKVTGSAIIAAHKALEARLVDFKTEHDLREVEPGPLTAVFAIAPPLEKQRALEFERADWTAKVELQSLPVRFSADGVLLAQATDAGILLSQQLSLSVEQGALRSLKVRLPASLPEATVTGEQLREMRTSIVGDQREYECSFQAQGGLLGWSALTFTLQLPISDAELALPMVQIENVERLRRYFIIDNASSREAKTLEATGVEPTPKESLPYVPELLTQPKFYLAHTTTNVTDNGKPKTENAALRLAFTQLQATEGNAAIVTLADITTVLRKDGERWDTVVYSLYNRSLQFLPVVLPDKAELIAVSVSGEPVRADEDHVARDGSQRRVRLIPLIQTRPGQRSMEVRLVYRVRTDPSLPKSVSLDDPELVGLSAERTVWTATLPKGYTIADTLRDTFGNMEPIAEESREAELLQGMMSDLARINRVLSLKRSSGAVYGDEDTQALAEAQSLWATIGEQTKRVEAKQNGRYVLPESGDDDQEVKQTEVFKSKLGKDISILNDNLKVQSTILTENRVAQPVFDDLQHKQQAKKRSTLSNTTHLAKIGDGKLLLANGNTWNAQGDVLKNRSAGNTDNNANAALGLNDNVGVNNGFFASSAPPATPITVGSGGIIKSGSGTLTISGANTYTGGTTVTAGTLVFNGGTTVNQGTLGLTNQAGNVGNANVGGSNVGFGGIVSNAGGSQTQTLLNNGGATNVATTNTYTGATTLSSSSTIAVNGGTLNYNSNARGNLTFNSTGGTSNASQLNSISGTGSVNSLALNSISNATSQTQTAVNDLNGMVQSSGSSVTAGNITLGTGAAALPATSTFSGTITDPAKPLNRGMRFGQAAINPDSIDGLVSATPSAPITGREDVAKILAEDSGAARLTTDRRRVAGGAVGGFGSGTPTGTRAAPAPDDPFAAPATDKPSAGEQPMLDGFDKAAALGDMAGKDRDGTHYLTTQTVNQLRPTGRRSLAISVPAEGPTYHFRKLKDHAVLAFEMHQQADKAKQAQAWGFVIALALLLGGAALREWWAKR